MLVDRASKLRSRLLMLAFVMFLYPVSIDDIGVNYAFLLLPLAYVLYDGKAQLPSAGYRAAIVLYIAIFIVGATYQYDYHVDALRRTTSFLLFMSMFAYMFVRIDAEMIVAFKNALITISVLLSAVALLVFAISGGSVIDLEEAKNLVGSQRIGFVYLLALWLLYLDEGASATYRGARIPLLIILLAGLLLTFSRSSIVALLVSVVLYAATALLDWVRRPRLRLLWHVSLAVAGIAAAVALLYIYLPLAFLFFEERLVGYLLDPAVRQADLSDPTSTGGNRLFLLYSIAEFVLRHPLTGSAYLGVWVAFGDHSGSAHSQYTDVLFRTGLLGFAAYLVLLFLIGKHLQRNERGLFWGYIAVVCYGLFHETFKESHGSFVLAFLLGILSQRRSVLTQGSGFRLEGGSSGLVVKHI